MSVPVNNLAVSSFYSKEEREELIKINQQYLEEVKKAHSNNNQQDAIKAMEKSDRKLKDLYERVKKRYIDHFKGDMDAILSDASAILQVVKKKHFQDEIRTIKFLTPKEEEVIEFYKDQPEPQRSEKIQRAKDMIKTNNKAAVANYENCYNFLLLYLDVQIEALQYYGLPLSGLEELTAAKASEWYVRTDFTPQIPHTKQFKKLEKFYFLADPITAGIFNGKHVIKTSNFIAIIDFETLEGVKLSRELSLYEKFVWHAIVNLVIQDHHEILTLNQIYKAMGNNGKPNEKTKKEILDAVENISRVRVSIDIPTDKEIYPGIDKFKGSFQLLATNTKQALSRGQIARDSIQILEEPQLFYFAKALNKVYSLPAIVLEVPISKTKANFTLLNYILQSILKLKKEEESEILLDALFVKCGIDFNDRTKKSRLLNQNNGTLRKILNHFAETKFIKKYEITTRKIKITF